MEVRTAEARGPEGEPLRLSECVSRLTEISRELGNGRLDVEEALVLAEEGMHLHRRATEVLSRVRLRIASLVAESEAVPLADTTGTTGA